METTILPLLAPDRSLQKRLIVSLANDRPQSYPSRPVDFVRSERIGGSRACSSVHKAGWTSFFSSRSWQKHPTKLAFAFLLPAFAGELSSLSQPLCGVSDFSKDQTAI
jgi:hypothetical protein